MESRTRVWGGLLLLILLSISQLSAQAQSIVRGFVFDATTQERLIGAKVSAERLGIEATTNVDGRFILDVSFNEALKLEFSAKGYQTRVVTIYDTTVLEISMDHIFAQGFRELDHTESIYGSILESDRNADKIQGIELFAIANGQMLGGLTNYAGVYGYHSGLNHQTIGMRGFTLVSHDRMLTSVNGIDARLPGFASSLGGFSNPVELDVESVELINGPSSLALGDGAYQGALSIKTKDPWNYRGLEARVYGGSSSALDAQLRFAQPFGKSKKWAVSASAQFQRIDDQAGLTQYGGALNSYDLDSILQNPGEPFTSNERALLNSFQNWLNSSGQGAEPGMLFPSHSGFDESEVFEPEGRKLKLAAGLHFKPTRKTTISYSFRMSNGSMVYANDQRYALNNITWHQHDLTAKGDNWQITALGAFESTGNSYSIRRNARLILNNGSEEFTRRFLVNYADSLRVWSNGFHSAVTDSVVSMAWDSALVSARSGWWAPGTTDFDSIAEVGQGIRGLTNGAGLYSISNRQGINGSYRFDFDWLKVHLGAKFKRNAPNSDGHLFSDTVDLSYLEYGGWTNFNFNLLNERLEMNAGLRVEKTDLTTIQVAPRFGIRFKIKEHAIRASFNSGFRNPSFWEFYRTDVGGNYAVLGNQSGYANAVHVLRADSIAIAYRDAIINGVWPARCDEGDEECLRSLLAALADQPGIAQLQPERVNSIELGYRAVLFKNFYMDLSVYHAWHYNLISYDNFYLLSGEVSDQESVINSLTDSLTDRWVYLPFNSTHAHRTIGGSLLATYHFSDRIWANLNYTYTQDLNEVDGSPTVIINVPRSKVNVGIRVKDLWQHLGFSLNYQWLGNHWVGGTFNLQPVAAYSLLDAQISYRIPVMYSTLRIGGSNIINSPIRQIPGGPALGATFYAAIQFDLNVR